MKNPERVAELLAELRALAETPLEVAIVDRCEKDLSNPPAIKNVSETVQSFVGIKFYRDKNGYFKSNAAIHQLVCVYFNGEIPEGYEIHHIDSNKSNNEPENLLCLSKAEHTALHATFPVTKEYTCLYCGKTFVHENAGGIHKFCSRSCRSAWNYRNVQEERVCVICGEKFMAPKYKSKKCCSSRCAGVLASQTKQPSDEIKNEIRRLYVKGNREFGTRGLALKFHLSRKTIQKIIRES